jgi:hypothetical protein
MPSRLKEIFPGMMPQTAVRTAPNFNGISSDTAGLAGMGFAWTEAALIISK